MAYAAFVRVKRRIDDKTAVAGRYGQAIVSFVAMIPPIAIRTLVVTLHALLLLPAPGRPARHPAYEPPLALPAAAGAANLFRDAETSASGHWADRRPSLAVNGNKDVADHWAAENLPVWHQVHLKEETELAAIRIWPYWADGRVYQYVIEGSTDGREWRRLVDQSANSITASAEGNLHVFEPARVRHIRTTFTGNSRGKVSGGHIVEIEGYAKSPDAALTGGIASSDARVPPQGPVEGLRPAAEGIRLHGWRGERVHAQVALTSEALHPALRLETPVLQGPGKTLAGSARFVRYTLADGKPQGDILDDATELDLPAGANRPVWLEFNIPADAPPGRYQGGFTVRSQRGELHFPIHLEIISATLPPPADWAIHLDLWQHPVAVARWHDVPAWSDEHLALLRPAMRRLAEAGQKTITTTLIHEPWGAQTYDWFPSMITWHKRADGTWHYDYRIFDRWVGFMSDECGLAHARIHGYSMIPWSLAFRYFDEASATWVDAKLQPGTAEFDAFWGNFLRDFKAHLRSKGWLERMRIAVDERPDHLMRGALATLARHAPEILVASAINHPSELTREVDDISPILNHVDNFPRALLDERRAAGRKSTFYVCTAPAVPNTFTFSPPAESEWLPLFAAANGFDGFLRWAYHSWVENPLVSTDFVTWPSGDCFLVYPGDRSSIRFERLRDGIESFEKIRLLREHAARTGDVKLAAALRELDAAFADFTWARGSRSGVHAGDVRRVNEILLAASRLLAAERP